MPLFNWPYTNLHNLNLDWIIKKIKNVETAETNTAASEEAAAGSAASAAKSEENAAASETNAAASATAAGNYYNQIRDNVSTLVTGWMDEHITPTTPPVDDTLTIQGAAADAKKTGDEVADLKNAIEYNNAEIHDVDDWLGFPYNIFDARAFSTTTPSNWTVKTSIDSITVTHLTTFTTGLPEADLNLPAGQYVVSAKETNISSSDALFDLMKNGVYFKTVFNGTTITIESGNTYKLNWNQATQGTEYYIRGLSVKQPISENGLIMSIKGKTDSSFNTLEKLGVHKIYEIADSTALTQYVTANGALAAGNLTSFYSLRCEIEKGDSLKFKATTAFGNPYYAIYDSNMTPIFVSDNAPGGGTVTAKTYEIDITNDNAAYILVNSHADNSAYIEIANRLIIKPLWDGLKWVCIGDSLTERNIRTDVHYYDYVQNVTNIEPIVMGVSGTGYARGSESQNAFYQRIMNIDTSADVVTIFGSFNDLGSSLPLGTITDNGTNTIAGCINTTFDNLFSVMPLANLGVISPTPWESAYPGAPGNSDEYVELLKGICERRSIPFLDMYHCSGLRPWDAAFREIAYSKDDGGGTHPDETGHKIIAPRFESFLDSLLMH